jgi:hypothetical protein
MIDRINQGLPRAWGEFTASIENLIQRIGESGVTQRIVSMLDSISSMVNALASVNPKILEFSAVMAGIAVSAGGVMLAVSGIGRLVGILLGARTALTAAGALTAGASGLGTATAVGAGATMAARLSTLTSAVTRLVNAVAMRLGIAGAGLMALDIFDRDGNLWGFTESIDRWMQWDPRDIFGGRVMTIEELDRRLSLAPPPPPPGAGPQAGSATGGSLPPWPAETLRRQLEAEMSGTASVATGAGQAVGAEFFRAITEAMRSAAPELRRELEAMLAQLRLSVTVSPRIDASRIDGVFSDGGATTGGR